MPTRSCARPGACSSRAVGCCNGVRSASTSATVALSLAGVAAIDVDCAGVAIAHAAYLAVTRPPVRIACRCRSCCCGSPHPLITWWSASRWCSREPKLDTRPAGLPAHAGPAHLGVLRDVRRTRGQLAAAGQFPGAAGADRCASHLADQHRSRAARQPGGLRLRLPAGGPTARAHHEVAAQHGSTRALSRSLLQLVRHADAASRCCRCTSRRWTAATSPRTC